MSISCSNINNIYYVITSIVPLIFTVKSSLNNKIDILNKVELTKESKEKIFSICDRMHEKISSSITNNVYYFEDELGIKFIAVGLFDCGKLKHTIVLGPYLTNSLSTHFDSHLQILSSDQEKIIATIALSLASYQVDTNDFIKLNSEDGKNSIFTDKDTKKNVADIRQRYYIEKKLLDYISRGDKEKALALLEKLTPLMNVRFANTNLRSIKNLVLSFNTLYRKAIEKNNIDSFCLHITSKRFENEIENINTLEELKSILSNMVIYYCDLINNYHNTNYSKIVSNSINYIRVNSKKDITLEAIAKELYVHKTYLAKKFKEETGKTTSQYINEIRIEEAKFMLLNTDCSIEQIGHQVGYNDSKYFSKIFKKIVDKSPSEFRLYKKK